MKQEANQKITSEYDKRKRNVLWCCLNDNKSTSCATTTSFDQELIQYQTINNAADDTLYVNLKKRIAGADSGHHLWLGHEWKFVEVRFEAAFKTR